MKLLLTTFLLLVLTSNYSSQVVDTINVNCFIHPPFCFKENNQIKGFEIDIINEYVLWLKIEKKQNVAIKYVEFADYNTFYNSIKNGSKNSLGAGSAIVGTDKTKEIEFTCPYLKNVAFCITNGNAPDLKTKTPADIVKVFGSMTALTITNTALSKHIADLKKTYIGDLKIKYEVDEVNILNEISKNVLNFAYINALEFWFYLKANPSKFLKMQKILNLSKEGFGFLIPKNSSHKISFLEFFKTFKASRNYRAILEKYMGSYMTQNMAVD